MGGTKPTLDGLKADAMANTTVTIDDRIGSGMMLFGIRSQLTILVIMLVSSTD